MILILPTVERATNRAVNVFTKCVGCACEVQICPLRLTNQLKSTQIVRPSFSKPENQQSFSKATQKPVSKISKIIQEAKDRIVRERGSQDVHGRVRDGMGEPMPFIVQKLQKLQDVRLKSARKKQLQENYKLAMEAVARGDSTKTALMDVYGV